MLDDSFYRKILDKKQDEINILREGNIKLLQDIEVSKTLALADSKQLDMAQANLDRLYAMLPADTILQDS